MPKNAISIPGEFLPYKWKILNSGELLPYKWRILNSEGALAPLFFSIRKKKGDTNGTIQII